jgi:amino acid adenylation domain-containing protein
MFVEFPAAETETSIPARFDKIVNLYPYRLAVKDNNQSLSYDQLNQASNRIAHAILDRCGDKLNPIVILTDHSVQSIVSFLGVLKAGKILVALDPFFPVDRLKIMLEDSKAEAILAYGDYLELASRLSSRERGVVNIDALDPRIPVNSSLPSRRPDDPAILRYTSGSSGTPKGVLTNHRRNLATYMPRINSSHICPEDRIIVLRRLTFGPTDSFSSLLAGAAALLFDINERGLLQLGDFLRQERVTYLVATPSIFRCFAQDLKEHDQFPDLRVIQTGGEPLFRADLEHYRKHCTDTCFLLNQFSSSEMGPVCQYWISKESKIDTPIVPVGYPVEGKRVFLFDDQRKEIKEEQIGEIAVASRYLSSGYWNDTELTNSKFFDRDSNPNERLYLSGDVGRMLPDGCLIYVGRKDDQVKIRGAKVEIREVEAILSQHPQVKDSAVIANTRVSGEKYLAAYIVALDRPAPTVGDIKDYLRLKLPDYMIPSTIMFLDSLPWTNGKLDRKALSISDDMRPLLSTLYTTPKNETEKRLVQIWEEVLNVRPVGIHDKFFELGGHSLAAARVISRVIKQFGLEIALDSLFQSPTIFDMATLIAKNQSTPPERKAVATILDELESLSDEEAGQRLHEIRSSDERK